MVALLPDAIGESKAIEDLEAPTLEAIGLAVENFGASPVDNASANAEPRGPCGSHQTGRRLAVLRLEHASAIPCRPSSYDQEITEGLHR